MNIACGYYTNDNNCLQCLDGFSKAIEIIINAIKSNKKLLVCGNGGSSSDSEHIVAELIKTKIPREPIGYVGFKAISLSSNSSVLTSISNDCGYKWVFAQQVIALGDPGDVLLAISTSGCSENVNLALEVAKQKGLKTIILTGPQAENALTLDCIINACGESAEAIQEKHIQIYHNLCRQIIEMCK